MALNLAFETVGSGPPLLVLHGLFGSSSNWRGVARQLGETHTVHSVDLRNHGASPWADSMAYTDPEVAWAGKTEDQCKAEGLKFGKAVFPWAASGRAIANGRDEGFTKLLFDTATHRVIGGGIVGTHAGDLISEICLAIEMGCEPADIGKTIHPHPTLGESIGMAAEVFEGHCTDLPPQKKK